MTTRCAVAVVCRLLVVQLLAGKLSNKSKKKKKLLFIDISTKMYLPLFSTLKYEDPVLLLQYPFHQYTPCIGRLACCTSRPIKPKKECCSNIFYKKNDGKVTKKFQDEKGMQFLQRWE